MHIHRYPRRYITDKGVIAVPPQPVPLLDLLGALEPLLVTTRHVYNVPIAGLAFDSRRVARGDLFVAVTGFRQDGHAFIAQALERGAAALVTEREVPVADVPVIRVRNARRALAALACRFFAHPSAHLNVIGITGTNGKTTAAAMLRSILAFSGNGCGLIGTVDVVTGRRRLPARLTTPEAPEIQAYLNEMRDAGLSHAVMEVSAQGVELERVTGTRFVLGGVTNVSTDHLDFYPSLGAYARTKGRFLAMVSPDRPVLVNADNDLSLALARAYHPENVVTYAVDGPADVSAGRTALGRHGASFQLTIHRALPRPGGGSCGPLRLNVRIPLLGKQNVYNALLAATAALVLDAPPYAVVRALRTFRGVARRMQVYRAGPLTVVDDTALNPASIDAVMATIRSVFGSQRLTAVYAVRGGRGPEINRRNALVFASWLARFPGSRLIATSSAGEVGAGDVVSPEEEEAFHATLRRHGISCPHYSDLRAALAAALDITRGEGILVLLGAQGMDNGSRVLFELLAGRERAGAPEIAFPAPVPSAARQHILA
ncbi:MAG: Mur ligase family protein [Bacillota bacterium]